MTGCTAAIPKDRNHSLNSGTPASPCSSSTKSTDAMPLQCRPRHHRIWPPEASGLLPRQGSPTHQRLVTLYLLKAIKGACMDHSRGHDQEENITRSHNSPGPCEGSSRATHTHTLHARPKTWEPLPLSLSLVTPTTSTLVQDNTDLSPPLDVGHSLARTSINRLCSSCTPSGPSTRRHSLLVGARTVVSYTDRKVLNG
jgi:hypothetical protein